ncbi:DUF5060 domain-containing protein [Paenibacillus tarimensis]
MTNKWIFSLVISAVLVIVIALLLHRQESPSPVETEPVTEETKGPAIRSATPDRETAGQYEKMEWILELSAEYDDPYDPEEIDLRAEFIAPSGKIWPINGFFDGSKWKLRFAADETGEWAYRFLVTDMNGTAETEPAVFHVESSAHHGWLQVSKSNQRTLSYHDGIPFYGVGIALPWNITESKLDRIAEHGGNLITYWNGNYDTAGIGGGKNQLESVQSGIGKYDVMKGYRIDQLVDWFEQRDLLMNFVIWPHDSLADKIDWPSRWHDNAYSLLGEAVDFYSDDEMWHYQERLYRYIIARWGYSRSIGIWDLICEVNGTDGWLLGDQEAANAWVSKVHRYFKDNDPFQRPTKGSMAGGIDGYWDHAYRTLDIADRENYFDLHYGAFAEDIRNRWANYEKPLFIGESGNVTDARIYHNALWVSLANGLASSPIWWDESKMNDEMFKHMKVFAEFVAGIDISEKREPVKLTAPYIRQQLDAEMPLSKQGDLADWLLPDWAEANKDGDGKIFAIEQGNEGTVSSRMRFASGGFAQGVIEHAIQTSDWSIYDEFQVELFVDHDGAAPLLLYCSLTGVGPKAEMRAISRYLQASG